MQDSTDLVQLALGALQPIAKKLQGIYSLSRDKEAEKEIPTSSLVQVLIAEATDLKNLVSYLFSRSHTYLLNLLLSRKCMSAGVRISDEDICCYLISTFTLYR